MKIILVYSPEEAKRNSFVVEKFKEKLNVELVTPNYRGNADFVINRSNDFEIANYYESIGIKVFNGAEFTKLVNDKQACYDFMKVNGIEILPTRYRVVPFVKKPKNGHGGNGVVMCHSLDYYDENMVCQKPASDLGRDVRVWVLNNEIIGAIIRISDTDFRSNYCLGGRAEKYNLTEKEKNKVKKIIDLVSSLGGVYYGIDFVFNNGEMVFNEIEDTVGARMLYDKTNLDIIDMYINYVKSNNIPDRKRNKKLVANAKNLRKNMTKEEKHLWYDYLRNNNGRFVRQKILGRYIVDFYSAKTKLVIELDGSQHFEKEKIKYDTERTKYLEQYGLKVIRITNDEINRNFDGVCEFLESEIKKASPV